MDYKIRGRLELDDNNTYEIVSKATYEEKIYYYLVDINNYENIMFCYENKERGSLIKEENPQVIRKLVLLFVQNIPKDVLENVLKTVY